MAGIRRIRTGLRRLFLDFRDGGRDQSGRHGVVNRVGRKGKIMRHAVVTGDTVNRLQLARADLGRINIGFGIDIIRDCSIRVVHTHKGDGLAQGISL